ncbi:preprotein translocase subunit SecY [Candidatus Saccharibacteria bacterium]|nr:preprotein translocase subunit SecY [Candidatus Saccharibacteria bacterium]
MNFKLIFKSLKFKDMRNRVLGVLGIFLIFRFLAHVPVPLADPTALKDVLGQAVNSSQLGGFLNLLTGGALANFSIVLVGMSPYITASIVVQLLTKAVPKLEEIHRDGESGRRKIQQWTRRITLPLAIFQSVAYIFILRSTVLSGATALGDMDLMQWVIAVTAMTAGAMLLMWMGEIITEKGIGNGMSLLIFAGIIAQIPQTFGSMISALTTDVTEESALHIFNWFTIYIDALTFWILLVIGIISLGVIYFLVKINEGQRIVTINYAKRVHGNSQYGGIKSILPIKLITAGVIPVIFAVAFLALPAFIGQLLVASGSESLRSMGENLTLWFQTPSTTTFALGVDWTMFIYPAAYFFLVVGFTYFYTSIVFNSDEIAENLQKQGGFIAGMRPGSDTAKYLKRIVTRLTLFGSIALGIISILPFVAEYIFAITGSSITNLAVGGTGLLIVVSVALESLRQLNSRALMVAYDEYEA